MDQNLLIAKEAVLEKKAMNVTIMDLRGISSVTDYFLICSGLNPVQVRAITDHVIDKMKEAGFPLPAKEGYHDGRWILLDCGNLVIHVMQQNEREFYALENLWHDAKVLTI
jgi:ribosome-associated protein